MIQLRWAEAALLLRLSCVVRQLRYSRLRSRNLLTKLGFLRQTIWHSGGSQCFDMLNMVHRTSKNSIHRSFVVRMAIASDGYGDPSLDNQLCVRCMQRALDFRLHRTTSLTVQCVLPLNRV